VESPDDQVYQQTRASNKVKTRRKAKVRLLSWNKNRIPVSASSPRISSSPQGLLLAVYLTDLFNGVATWKGIKQKQPMQVQRILVLKKKKKLSRFDQG
jgi:hypothetical protein